jgi:alanine racemase
VVLLQGFFEAAEVREIARWNLTPVVHSAEQLALLLSSGSAAQMEIYLKLNSGMNRLGLPEAEWRAAIPNLERSGVRRITLMTHFSAAEETAGIQEQLDRFNHAAIGLRHPRSLANSAALLRFPSAIGDWARPGLMLYGASPFTDRSASSLGLRPAMTLSSAIIATQNLAPGARVGYGGTFTADRALRIGVVACGYGDGYPRHAPTGTPVLVDGTRTRILGRISMDMLCVDLTPLPQAGVGTEVILWGGALPVEEVAKWSDTVSYELLCALAPRVPVVESDG